MKNFPGEIAGNSLAKLREKSPKVICLTNSVVKNFTANALLALGASPIMIEEKEELDSLAYIPDSLLVNIGTLCNDQKDSIISAIKLLSNFRIPWIFDPVGVGLSSYRKNFAKFLLSMHPKVIRGNASEILMLADNSTKITGIDSEDHPIHALNSAIVLAKKYETIVVITGAIDIITDGEEIWKIEDGHPIMTRVTGIGCILSAIVAAFCSLPGRELDNVSSACKIMSCAGRLTTQWTKEPGSFSFGILNELYKITDRDIC